MKKSFNSLGIILSLVAGSILVSCGGTKNNTNQNNKDDIEHKEPVLSKEYVEFDFKNDSYISESEANAIFKEAVDGIKGYKGAIEYRSYGPDRVPNENNVSQFDFKTNACLKVQKDDPYRNEYYFETNNNTVTKYSKNVLTSETRYDKKTTSASKSDVGPIHKHIRKNKIKTLKDAVNFVLEDAGFFEFDKLIYDYLTEKGTKKTYVRAYSGRGTLPAFKGFVCFDDNFIYQTSVEIERYDGFAYPTTEYKGIDSFNYEYANALKEEVLANI